jgi:DNA-binding transcriptional regulator YbjK
MANGQSPRQDRSRRRREALLRATIELLGETGAKSVTHRAVAERAGLPLASTTYYFASVRQLIEEALKLHVAERVAELQGLAAVALGTAGASATDIAERLAEVLASAPTPILMAQYQMYLEAGRNPALQPAVAEALAAFEGLAAGVLAALGARDPEPRAEAFVALLDGFALHRVARPRDPSREATALAAAMRALFLEQVMNPDAREELHARLREPLAPAADRPSVDRPAADPPAAG